MAGVFETFKPCLEQSVVRQVTLREFDFVEHRLVCDIGRPLMPDRVVARGKPDRDDRPRAHVRAPLPETGQVDEFESDMKVGGLHQ